MENTRSSNPIQTSRSVIVVESASNSAVIRFVGRSVSERRSGIRWYGWTSRRISPCEPTYWSLLRDVSTTTLEETIQSICFQPYRPVREQLLAIDSRRESQTKSRLGLGFDRLPLCAQSAENYQAIWCRKFGRRSEHELLFKLCEHWFIGIGQDTPYFVGDRLKQQHGLDSVDRIPIRA